MTKKCRNLFWDMIYVLCLFCALDLCFGFFLFFLTILSIKILMDHFMLSCMKYILKQIILYKFIKSLVNLFIHFLFYFPIAFIFFYQDPIFLCDLKQLEHKVIRTSYYICLFLVLFLMRIYIQMMTFFFKQKTKRLLLE